MEVRRSKFIFRNVLVYIFLSILFLFAIQAISSGYFVFSKQFGLLALKNNYLIILFSSIVFYFIFTFKKYSEWLLLIFIILIVIKSFIFLSSSFNKLILGLNFIYLVFSFYFFTSWELFTLSAVHNPNYAANDLEKKSRFEIEGYVFQNEVKVGSFLLTNIDINGCFVMNNSDSSLADLKLQEQVRLEIDYEKVLFKSEALCVSRFNNGLGFEFVANDDLRSMSGLYQVCLERGLFN